MLVGAPRNRKNLWKYGKRASEVMREIAKYVDVAIANEEDVQKSLEITVDDMTSSPAIWIVQSTRPLAIRCSRHIRT